MTQKISNLLRIMLVAALFSGFVISCKDDSPNGAPADINEFKVAIPENVDLEKGGIITISQEGGKITTSDKIYLEHSGQLTLCNITEAGMDHFTFSVPDNIVTGTYRIHVGKDGKRTLLGTLKITIVARRIPIPDGATVYGIIETTDGKPVANVVVSDGENCTVSNADGIYGLASDKEQGYVFMSVPSGYEPETAGVFPKMYQRTALSKDVPENISFTLKKVEGQDNFKVLFFGTCILQTEVRISCSIRNSARM